MEPVGVSIKLEQSKNLISNGKFRNPGWLNKMISLWRCEFSRAELTRDFFSALMVFPEEELIYSLIADSSGCFLKEEFFTKCLSRKYFIRHSRRGSPIKSNRTLLGMVHIRPDTHLIAAYCVLSRIERILESPSKSWEPQSRLDLIWPLYTESKIDG